MSNINTNPTNRLIHRQIKTQMFTAYEILNKVKLPTSHVVNLPQDLIKLTHKTVLIPKPNINPKTIKKVSGGYAKTPIIVF